MLYVRATKNSLSVTLEKDPTMQSSIDTLFTVFHETGKTYNRPGHMKLSTSVHNY